MSRSLAKSGKATVTKSLKEKWESSVQLARENGEKEVGSSSTVTVALPLLPASLHPNLIIPLCKRHQCPLFLPRLGAVKDVRAVLVLQYQTSSDNTTWMGDTHEETDVLPDSSTR